MSKIGELEVIAIRKSEATSRELAAQYGISQAHVNQIRARRRWQHIV